jgi:hypothetical protein
MTIGTVISYCTNDWRFLNLCIEEARRFSSQVIVVVCDHFFDGTPEDRALLEWSYAQHPDCLFLEFTYDPEQPYGLYCPVRPGEEDWAHYWHSTGRYIGYHYLDEAIETVLFADVDEIYDGNRFQEWLENFDYRSYEAIRFASYYYFREAKYRALSWLPLSLLARKEAILPELLLDLRERQGVFEGLAGQKMMQAVGLDGQPLLHHYSWVKTKEEMLIKARTWGHRHERDWIGLIEEEFSHPFNGTEAFYGMHYEEVESWRDPLAAETPLFLERSKNRNNVLQIDRPAFLRETILKKKP